MLADGTYLESTYLVRSERGQLVGILCAPISLSPKTLNDSAQQAEAILVIVPDPDQTRVGFHRIFVTLSRYLARQGISSYRVDCSGSGDSLGTTISVESMKFDILKIIQSLHRERPDAQLSVLGFGEGATAAILALPLLKADHRTLKALICINPSLIGKHQEALVSTHANSNNSKNFLSRLHFRFSGLFKAASPDAQISLADQSNEALQGSELSRQVTNHLEVISGNFGTFFSADRQAHRLLVSNAFDFELTTDDPDGAFTSPESWAEICSWVAARLRR